MPDPILGTAAGATGQEGQQGAPQQQSQQQGQPSQQGSQEPKWLSYIPETEREDARKAYMLNSDYTKKTQELSERQKSWESEKETLSRQNKEYLEGWQNSYKHYEDLKAKFERNPTEQNRQNLQDAAAEQQKYWEGYEYLQPHEQAMKIAQYNHNLLNQQVAQYARAFQEHYQKQLQQQVEYINNYFGTYLDAQQRFPGNAVQQKAYLESIYKVRSGEIDPRELAAQRVTAEQDRQALIEEGRKLGVAEAENKFKTQNGFDLTGTGTPQPYRPPALGDRAAREQALNQAITQKFGSGVWSNT